MSDGRGRGGYAGEPRCGALRHHRPEQGSRCALRVDEMNGPRAAPAVMRAHHDFSTPPACNNRLGCKAGGWLHERPAGQGGGGGTSTWAGRFWKGHDRCRLYAPAALRAHHDLDTPPFRLPSGRQGALGVRCAPARGVGRGGYRNACSLSSRQGVAGAQPRLRDRWRHGAPKLSDHLSNRARWGRRTRPPAPRE